MSRLRVLTSALARVPWAFDTLRNALEFGYRGHRAIIQRELLPVRGDILDCGCGTGIFAPMFPPERYRGVDVNRAYIDAARQKYPAYWFRVMDATQLEFREASLQAAMLSGVLHHLDDETAGRVLRALARVLEPGARLVVWEDIPTRSRLNLIGDLVHRFDEGAHIRPVAGYQALLSPVFEVQRGYLMRSGFMDYAVFVCANATP